MTVMSALAYVVAIFAVVSATDYCSDKICKKGVKHAACGHNGEFDKSCPHDAEMVTMTNDLRQILVDGHNDKRNFIAGGGRAKISPACRMATMEWDEELAVIAAFNVKQCKMAHDKCRNTDAFKFSGQNLAWFSFSGDFDHADKLKQAIQMWYDEVKHTKQCQLDYFKFSSAIGHFTVMMADRNIRVGCAASVYSASGKGNMRNYLVACNYATTNMIGYPIYRKCKKAATSCTSGTNPKYPHLCSTAEQYDVNKWP